MISYHEISSKVKDDILMNSFVLQRQFSRTWRCFVRINPEVVRLLGSDSISIKSELKLNEWVHPLNAWVLFV